MADSIKIIDDSEVEKTIEEVNRLKELVKEANALLDELASKDLEIHIKL